MALTVGTQRLGLPRAEAQEKSLVLVKLTDSSLGAIAQFLRQRNQSTQPPNFKPTIQILQNSGTICIPIGDDGRHAKFTFSLASTEDIHGPQGSFECLQSIRAGHLESLGPIQEKLTVQASDESYTRFGEKMVEVKKENEKRTTVFIDRPGAGGGLVGGGGSSTQKIVRKIVNISTQKPIPRDASSHHHRMTEGHTANRLTASGVHNPGSTNPSDVLSSSHPILERFPPNKSSTFSKINHQNTEVMKRPLRERIVHLLAVRPFKKPELLLRITRDGIREKDKNSITIILKQVSAMKDNTYHLLRHIWNDVSEDWPFYTEEERQSFRRRKPQNLTPPGSDGSSGSSISSGHSSSSSHPASPQPPSTLKRASILTNDKYFEGLAGGEPMGPNAKKKRVSNYIRPPDLSVSSGVYSGKSPLLVHSPSHNGRSPLNESNGRGIIDCNDGKVSGWLMSNGVRSSPSALKFTGGSLITPASSPDSQDYSAELMSSTGDLEMEPYNAKDYLVEFTPIANAEQRRLYKAEFNKNYLVYGKHHKYLEQVSRKFANLENQLKQEQEGSDTWKQLKLKIWEEYHNSKKDQKYTQTRQEFQYLHDKLAHIKMLVQEYDTKNMKQVAS